jgi:L-lactate dehydrogenase (cytochrome)
MQADRTRFDVNPVGFDDYREVARKRLPQFLFDYAEGGANEEFTTALNRSDFRRFLLKQRVLRDVSNIDTSTTIVGDPASIPVVLAPVGMAGMYARRGEVQGARAASRMGIPMATSTVGICSASEVQAASERPIWFQLYMLRDREFVLEMLGKAQDAGCTTLAFTVDLPMAGLRLRDFRNGMFGGSFKANMSKGMQLMTSLGWAWDVGIRGGPISFGNLADKVKNPKDLSSYKALVEDQFDTTATWKDIHWLRDNWKGKLLIKGVLEADDARAAVDAGADGVVVSNHGGRQLDSVASTITKLPAVAEAVSGQTEILMDGGVRSGLDVVKAVALGAQAVLIGRPWIYAMAANGEQGVVDLLTLFQKEISVAMALCGVNRVAELSPDVIERVD